MPELVNRRRIQSVWKFFERIIFPKLSHIITVNESIAELYTNEYKKKIHIVRNIPVKFSSENQKTREELGLPTNKKILILQGSGINIDRGAEEAVLAMQYLEQFVLLIVGSGDVIPKLKKMVREKALTEKVIFKSKMPSSELRQHTRNADLGLALDKDTNLNYRFSLPNKLFDYIHSGVPVLASDLPEIRKVIDTYKVGYFIPNHTPAAIATKIKHIFENTNEYETKKSNTAIASTELNWEIEEKKLLEVIYNAGY